MNYPILVTFLVLVAGSCVQSRRGHGGGGHHGNNACHKALEPTAAERTKLQADTIKCINAQTGLAAIIIGLGGYGHHRHNGGGYGHRDVATLLAANNYTTEATTLRTCIATEMGLVNTDGTFNMDTLKASILAKVTNPTIAANTQLGLTNCPVVVAFDVLTYLLCVRTYCQTGAAPTG